MWTYYGTKKRLAKYYPTPIYEEIVEPFCGAAQYSLFGDNWKKQVYLYDIYDKVIDCWKYLINATKDDILSLPDFFAGDSLDDHKYLSVEERALIGFCINPGSASPKVTARAQGNWSLPQAGRPSMWNRTKLEIAENLYKVKHWKAEVKDYRDINSYDKSAWFIDPPYQHGGIYYRYSSKKINYFDLAEWCKSREGQVIVCENTEATWLDFEPLVELNGQRHKTTEAIWYRED